MIQMQDVNIRFPATSADASLYTKDGNLAMLVMPSTALYFVSESLQEDGNHSSFQMEEIHCKRSVT